MISLDKHEDGVYRLTHPFPELEIGVAARSANPADYSGKPEAARRREKEFLEAVTGIGARDIVALDQEHGDTILFINEPPREERLIFGTADGLLTRLPGICLVIRTADCVPVFMYDPRRQALGAAHSGWRGTRLAIARTLAREMARRAGSEYPDLRVFILPAIGPSSYTVGRDVAGLFPRDTREKNGGIYLDLWGNIERTLADEGIPEENIFCARTCTLESNEELFSHRAGDRGRNLNYGVMRF